MAMSEERYQEIRRGVRKKRLERLVTKALGTGTKQFETVEEFMAYLGRLAPPEDRPAPIPKK